MVATFATLERRAAGLQRQIRDLKQHESWKRSGERTPLTLADELGITLDPWQRDAVTTDRHDVLLCVTRQGGKGLVASLLALDALVNDEGSTTLIISRAERQSKRLLKRTKRMYHRLSDVSPVISEGQTGIELRNGSEILALPGSEETIRGIEAVDLLIIDEGALVPDELFAAVHPMLATTDGRCVAMSTARGKRGWFWQEWEGSDVEWHRAKITAHEIPRINPEWLERTRNRIGDWMYRQEFLCEFLETNDQLFAHELVEGALSDDFTPLFGGLAA